MRSGSTNHFAVTRRSRTIRKTCRRERYGQFSAKLASRCMSSSMSPPKLRMGRPTRSFLSGRGAVENARTFGCESQSRMAERPDRSTPEGSPPGTVTQRMATGLAPPAATAEWPSSALSPRSMSARRGCRSSAARCLAAMNKSSGRSMVVFLRKTIFPSLWLVNRDQDATVSHAFRPRPWTGDAAARPSRAPRRRARERSSPWPDRSRERRPAQT